MASKCKTVDRNTQMLIPPDLRDWLPEDHTVHFIIEVVESMDLTSFKVNEPVELAANSIVHL